MTGPALDTDRRPFVLVWEVTQACELACKHCRADAVPDRHPDELSTAEAKTFLEDVRAFGEGQLLVLSGGDPLARDDIVELVEYGTDIGLSVTLTPSATTSLTRDRLQAFADAGLKRLALSIDAPTPTTHDEFRQEPGSFEQTLRAARATAAVGLPLQINTTVCAETVEHLPGMRSLLDTIDPVLWSVFFLVPVGRGADLDSITADEAEYVMKWLDDVATTADYAVKTTEAPHYRRVVAQRGTTESRGTGRGINAGDGFAFVSHRGDVYPSGFLPVAAGNVKDGDIVDIYRDEPVFEALRDPANLSGKCGSCPYRTRCGGSRSRAYAYTGDLHASDPLCAYVPPDYDGPLPGIAYTSDDPEPAD